MPELAVSSTKVGTAGPSWPSTGPDADTGNGKENAGPGLETHRSHKPPDRHQLRVPYLASMARNRGISPNMRVLVNVNGEVGPGGHGRVQNCN